MGICPLFPLITWVCEGKNVPAQATELKFKCVCKVLGWVDEMKCRIFYFFFPFNLMKIGGCYLPVELHNADFNVD